MPTLRERVSRWFGGGGDDPEVDPERKAIGPIEFHPPYTQYFGTGIGSQPSTSTLLQENKGVADIGTRAIANRVGSLNPQVKKIRRIADGTTEEEILDDHPLKLLLDRPHPNFSGFQLRRLMAQYIVSCGETFLLKVGNKLRVPAELHPIPPWLITPVLSQGVVTGYAIQDGSGRQDTIPADTVVRCFFPDPESPWSAEGYLGPSALVADSLKFSGEHLRSHYQHDASPKTALEATVDAVAWKQEDKDRFYAQWRSENHSRFGSNRGNPPIIPTGYKLIEIGLKAGVDIVPLLDHWQHEMLMSMGVPMSVLGKVVSGDRSSAETNQYVFDRHTVFPIASLISDALTYQLARDFDDSIYVEFEKFVSDDKDFGLAQETADLAGKVRSINQVREDRGLDPVEWGELPVGKLGEMPYDPDALFDMPEDATGAVEDEEPDGEDLDIQDEDAEESEDEPRTRAQGMAAYWDPEAEWKRFVNRERRWMPTLAKGMRIIFRAQQADVMKKLTRQRQRLTPEELFDPTDPRWRKLFEQNIEPTRKRAFLATLGEVLAGLGIEEFQFTDQMAAQLKRHGAELFEATGRTTLKKIRRALREELIAGTEEGESIDRIAKRLRGVFSERKKRHAVMIARTEIGRASTLSHIEGYKLAGVTRHRWNTSRDDAVRETHQIDGEIVPVGEPFVLPPGEGLGSELADGPREGHAGVPLSAGNAINCRCFLTAVIET